MAAMRELQKQLNLYRRHSDWNAIALLWPRVYQAVENNEAHLLLSELVYIFQANPRLLEEDMNGLRLSSPALVQQIFRQLQLFQEMRDFLAYLEGGIASAQDYQKRIVAFNVEKPRPVAHFDPELIWLAMSYKDEFNLPPTAREYLSPTIYGLLTRQQLFYGEGASGGNGDHYIYAPFEPVWAPSIFDRGAYEMGGCLNLSTIVLGIEGTGIGKAFFAGITRALSINPQGAQVFTIREVHMSSYGALRRLWFFYPIPHYDTILPGQRVAHSHEELRDVRRLFPVRATWGDKKFLPIGYAESELRMYDLYWSSPLARLKARMDRLSPPQPSDSLKPKILDWAKFVIRGQFQEQTNSALIARRIPFIQAYAKNIMPYKFNSGLLENDALADSLLFYLTGDPPLISNLKGLECLIISVVLDHDDDAIERHFAMSFLIDFARALSIPLFASLRDRGGPGDEQVRQKLFATNFIEWGLVPFPSLQGIGHTQSLQFGPRLGWLWFPGPPPSNFAAVRAGKRPFAGPDDREVAAYKPEEGGWPPQLVALLPLNTPQQPHLLLQACEHCGERLEGATCISGKCALS
jgi:hypothetical protein